MSSLYLECFSGISGDMFVAALLDLGADEALLRKVLKTIPLQGFRVNISRVKKAGLDVCDFDVVLEEAYENHDHDMAYLHGTAAQETAHEHSHEPQGTAQGHSHEPQGTAQGHAHDVQETVHEHSHEPQETAHGHSHEPQGTAHEHIHAHMHRGMAEVLEILGKTEMSRGARELAVCIFTILGEAEAKAHGTTLEEVHFHEVGAVDSIVDIVAAAVCMDSLHVEQVIVPVLYEGCGTIRCQHGILPIPVPAVLNIAEAKGLHLHRTEIRGELVTPTGAAIAAAIRTKECLPERFRVQKVGMGAGKRTYACPGILRAMLIEEECAGTDSVVKLESNIDDCSGEVLGYVLERLFAAGAKDVHYTPVFMKKNRPAYQLNVICDEEKVQELEQIIFRETTTIGIRRMKAQRSVLKREVREVETPYGTARVKICTGDGQKSLYPEYESVAELSKKSGKPFREIYDWIQKAGERCDWIQKAGERCDWIQKEEKHCD